MDEVITWVRDRRRLGKAHLLEMVGEDFRTLCRMAVPDVTLLKADPNPLRCVRCRRVWELRKSRRKRSQLH